MTDAEKQQLLQARKSLKEIEKLLKDTSNLSSFEAGRRAELAFQACRDGLKTVNALLPRRLNSTAAREVRLRKS